MPIQFPTNPTTNQTYTYNSVTWTWTGSRWEVAGGAGGGVAAVYDIASTSTGYFDLPSGNTAQRPGSPDTGMIRYNSTTGFAEVYTSVGWGSFGAQPPSISTVTPATYNGEAGTTFTINGANFTADAVVKFIDINGTEYTAGAVTFVNQTQLTATTPQDFTVAQEPLDVKVVQTSGQVTKVDCIDCGGTPTWSTAAGTIATINDEYGSYSPIVTLIATDPDAGATIGYSLVSGSLPAGTALGSSTGQISGNPTNVVSQTTSNFTIRATDNAGNSSDRAFSIIVNPTADGSTAARAGASAAAIKTLTGTTTNGTYWILVSGVATEIYCDMVTDGGGWMSFAAMPGTSGMFAGDSGNTTWSTNTYSYGTYDKAGGLTSYWRNIGPQTKTYVLFKTGNGTYWLRMRLDQVATNSGSAFTNEVATSNNFPSDANAYNTTAYVLFRANQGEDPWINVGNAHTAGNNYMFWGETGTTTHSTFKNNNGGVIAFVK